MRIATTVTVAERPDLIPALEAMPDTWPPFTFHDVVGELLYPRLVDDFPDHQLVALDESGDVVGRVHSIPFSFSGDLADLPERGWTGVLQAGYSAAWQQLPVTAVSLLEVTLVPAARGAGLSSKLVRAARNRVHAAGLTDLFAPVRPIGKADEPNAAMAEYAGRVGDDGLPADPWLRVHVRLGARVVRVCPASMTVPASLARWREWTGLPFDVSGPLVVPGALCPVHVSVEHDQAVYVEPNVWVHHRLA